MIPAGHQQPLDITSVYWSAGSGGDVVLRVSGRVHASGALAVPPVLAIDTEHQAYRFTALPEPPGAHGAPRPDAWQARFAVPASLAPYLAGGLTLILESVSIPLPAAEPDPGPAPGDRDRGVIRAVADPGALADRRQRQAELAEREARRRAGEAEASNREARILLGRLELELGQARRESERLRTDLERAERKRLEAEQLAHSERAMRLDLGHDHAARIRRHQADARGVLELLEAAQMHAGDLGREIEELRRSARHGAFRGDDRRALALAGELTIAASAPPAPIASGVPALAAPAGLELEAAMRAKRAEDARSRSLGGERTPGSAGVAPAGIESRLAGALERLAGERAAGDEVVALRAAPDPTRAFVEAAIERIARQLDAVRAVVALLPAVAAEEVARAGAGPPRADPSAEAAGAEAPGGVAVAPDRAAAAPGRAASAPGRVAVAADRVAVATDRVAVAPDRIAVAPDRLGVAPDRLAAALDRLREERAPAEPDVAAPADVPRRAAVAPALAAELAVARAAAGRGGARGGAPGPAAAVSEPAADVSEPAADVPEPAADVPEPAADVPEPAADVPEPAASANAPSAAAPEPTAEAELAPPVRAPRPDTSRWLLRALKSMLRDDPALAGNLVMRLVPAQALVLAGPVSYDIALAGGRVLAVTVRDDRVRLDVVREPRSLDDIDFRIEGDLAAVGRLVVYGRLRRRFSRHVARVRGDRRAFSALDWLVRQPRTLSELYAAGVRLGPTLVLSLVAHMVDPSWTVGDRFTVGHEAVGGDGLVYLVIREGERPRVSRQPPLGPVASTIRCSDEQLLALLATRSRDGVSISGAAAPISLLCDWIARAQRDS